jgi:hypothetical protein
MSADEWRKMMGRACPACGNAPDIACKKRCALYRASVDEMRFKLGDESPRMPSLARASVPTLFDEPCIAMGEALT